MVDSVTQAAPVLANLRNLALAEARAATDALTGLPNKRACADTLKRMVAHAGRSVSPLSALLLDLDHFKQINDTFGHGIGDDALAAVGDVISTNLRTSDFAGRYGGEEFLVLLPDTDREGAAQAAEKLRDYDRAHRGGRAGPPDDREPRAGVLPDGRRRRGHPGADGRPRPLRGQERQAATGSRRRLRRPTPRSARTTSTRRARRRP